MSARATLALLLSLGLAGLAVAQEAVFTELSGKVEFQAPGGSWKAAKVGDRVGRGVVVSTGFRSTALLKLGTATIAVKPVTRLTLEEIVRTEGGTQTKLYLLSGRVKADVPPQPGQTTDFKITSPTATASVRGTSFEFDGIHLIVERGSVRLATPALQFRYVAAGEFSSLSSTGAVLPPAAVSVSQGLLHVEELVRQQSDQARQPTGSVEAPASVQRLLTLIVN